jgi:hypothetical protein
MQARILGTFFVLAAFGLVAAGEGSPYEKSLQKVLDSFNQIGDSLKKIVDEDSAAAAKPELRKAADSFVTARTKAEKMQPPEKDEKVRLEKQFKAKLEESMKKMFTEVRRVKSIPGGSDAWKEISSIFEKKQQK